jgi:hypothetical protein
VDRVTADLCLRFSNGLRLHLLNNPLATKAGREASAATVRPYPLLRWGAVASPTSECLLWVGSGQRHRAAFRTIGSPQSAPVSAKGLAARRPARVVDLPTGRIFSADMETLAPSDPPF